MLDIKDLYEKDYLGKKVEICGWIKNHRKQANICFIDMYDGTIINTLQVVYDNNLSNYDKYDNFINIVFYTNLVILKYLM